MLDPSGPSRAELRTTVAAMLKVPSVTLADDALTADSLMIIEKVHPRDAAGISLSGRDFDKPEQFRPLKIGATYVLLQVRSTARRVLRQSHCAPARQPKTDRACTALLIHANLPKSIYLLKSSLKNRYRKRDVKRANAQRINQHRWFFLP